MNITLDFTITRYLVYVYTLVSLQLIFLTTYYINTIFKYSDIILHINTLIIL